jgi:rhodanese-related sulfurtransferase
MGVQLREAFLEHCGSVYGCTVHLDDLVANASAKIRRYLPAEALAASEAGAAIVDIRDSSRAEAIPGAFYVPRSVLEWRVASDEWRNTALDGKRLILVCDEGYSSILAAATLVELGRDAGDVVGGFEAWKAAGLPVCAPG